MSNLLEHINAQFNRELERQISGVLPQGHIYQLGMPLSILQSIGMPYLPIELRAAKLSEKAGDNNKHHHPFNLYEIENLPKLMQNPIAVFAYGDKTKAVNLITEIEHNGIKFLVGIAMNPTVNGKTLEINSVRNVFPRDINEWLLWIQQGKTLYLNKEKVKIQIRQQQRSLADVPYLDLELVTKVINSFQNPKFFDNKISKNNEKIQKVAPSAALQKVLDAPSILDSGEDSPQIRHNRHRL